MEDTPFPAVPRVLLETLERLYPNRCPAIEMSERQIWLAAGAYSVVRKLRAEHDRQINHVL
jgi:hypothetical protein